MKKLGLIVLMLMVLSSGSLNVEAMEDFDTWIIAGGGDMLTSVITDGTYIYVGVSSTPGKIYQINPDTMALVATWTGAVGEDNVNVLDSDGTYIYAGLNTNPAVVVQIDPATMTTNAEFTFDVAWPQCTALTHDGTYIYAGINGGGPPANITQIDPATMAYVDSYSGSEACEALAWDGTYVYAAMGENTLDPNLVLQIDPAGMGLVNTWTGAAGEVGGVALAYDGTYIYLGLDVALNTVIQIDPATMTTVDTWTGAAGFAVPIFGLTYDGTYIYAGLSTAPSSTVTIDPATMTTIDTWTGGVNEQLTPGLVYFDHYVYVASYLDAVTNDNILHKVGVDAPTVTAPASGESYGKGSPISVTWTLPAGVTQTAYQIQVGSVGFAVVYEDTGKVTSATTGGTIPAPSYSGAMALRVYYWDAYGMGSAPSTAVTLTVTGDGGNPPPPPPPGVDTDGDGLNDDVDPDDDNDGIPDYMDQNPLTPDTPPPITPPIEVPEWVPPPIADIIVKLYPWWQKYGAAVIIGCVVAAFLFYATGPKKSRRVGGLDVVLNPEKFLK